MGESLLSMQKILQSIHVGIFRQDGEYPCLSSSKTMDSSCHCRSGVGNPWHGCRAWHMNGAYQHTKAPLGDTAKSDATVPIASRQQTHHLCWSSEWQNLSSLHHNLRHQNGSSFSYPLPFKYHRWTINHTVMPRKPVPLEIVHYQPKRTEGMLLSILLLVAHLYV